MIQASKFSQSMGMPIVDAMNSFQRPVDHKKSPIWFLAGDPTAYGRKDLSFPEEGYRIVRENITIPENSSYTSSQGVPKAKEAVAKHFSSKEHQLESKDVFMFHGANMGLMSIFLASCNPGDNILVPEPSYPFYDKVGPAFGVDVKKYRLDPDKKWEIDLEFLGTLVNEKTKFIFIVNPSNPCGSIFSRKHMEDIKNFVRKHQIFIVSDEVYWNQNFSKEQFHSFGHLAEEVPIFVVGGMEKTFLVPGWCTSWVLIFDKNGCLKKISEALATTCQIWLHGNTFLMHSLPQLLDLLTLDYTQRMMPLFEENYNYVFPKFQEIKGMKPIEAQGTFYISVVFDLKQFKNFQSDRQLLQALLTEENVFILNLSAFGGQHPGLRLLTCAQKDHYDEMFARLKSFCERHYA